MSRLNKNTLVIIALLTIWSTIECAQKMKWPQKMVVSTEVTHLMSKPEQRPNTYERCPFQATQLIYGEKITAHEECNGWLRVKAIEQRASWNNKWVTCSGWIPAHHTKAVKNFPKPTHVVTARLAPIYRKPSKIINPLYTIPFGSHLTVKKGYKSWWIIKFPNGSQGLIEKKDVESLENICSKNQLRIKLVQRGMQFLGDPYLWAGRSAYNPALPIPTGYDCSGLVNSLYRSIGITIPRCSDDQYAKSRKMEKLSQTNIGDLVFIYYEKIPNTSKFSERTGHVMMYLGNDQLLEAEGDQASHIRIVRGRQRFGKPIETINSGQKVWIYKKLSESPIGNKKVVSSSPFGKGKIVFGSYFATR
jgi:hypothetical protein